MSKPLIEISTTNRGFERVEFEDSNAVKCHIQESSLATDDCIWLGCSDLGFKTFRPGVGWQPVSGEQLKVFLNLPEEGAIIANTAMHLNREQVKAILPFLQSFVETGELRSE